MDNKERKEILKKIRQEVAKLKLSDYHQKFLGFMILERIEHPTKKINELANMAMQRMKKEDKGILVTSEMKSLEELEKELDNCEVLNYLNEQEDLRLFNGKMVKNILIYLVEKITKSYEV